MKSNRSQMGNDVPLGPIEQSQISLSNSDQDFYSTESRHTDGGTKIKKMRRPTIDEQTGSKIKLFTDLQMKRQSMKQN